MRKTLDDNELRELLQRVKAADEPHVPSFDEVLHRSAPAPAQQPDHRQQLAAVCCAAATLLMAVWIGGTWRQNGSIDVERGIAQAPDSPNSEVPPVQIDFEQLYAVVDEQFAALSLPGWQTPSDALLAQASYEFRSEP